MACAVASFAALIGLEPSGIIQTARLAWGSVGPTVAAEKIRQAVAPIDNIRASADYRRQISGNLLYRLPVTTPAGNDA